MTPKPPKPPKDMEHHNNLLLIRYVKYLGRDIWYKTTIDEADRPIWKTISLQTRLKITFVQEQWLILLHQYIAESKNKLKILFCEQTEFMKKYGEAMIFLESDFEGWSMLLSDADTKMTEQSKESEKVQTDDSIAGTSTSSDVLLIEDDESTNSPSTSSTEANDKKIYVTTTSL